MQKLLFAKDLPSRSTFFPKSKRVPDLAAFQRGASPHQEHFNLPVAERCYAVLGDVAKSRYLHKVRWVDSHWVNEKALKHGKNTHKAHLKSYF